MANGRLYGVGVGPGDRELITLKALRVLREADIIAVPLMRSGARTAYEIIEDYIGDKKIIEFLIPMTKDLERLEKNYTEISDKLEGYLRAGKNIAFITLGDVTVYSSYMQINRRISERGYETELVAGIPSFCAAAARLNTALCERDEPLVILPAGYEDIEKQLDMKGTKVLMKAGRQVSAVRDILNQKGLAEKAVMVECCGMENEKIYTNLNDIDEKSSYFSIIIVKD
ncbi:MAG: precorrin-2 C(20)-methyltransferase [Candidatus Ornithomonoglobus sp.]